MDWTGCELVERVEGRCGGALTVVGTRVFPETIVGDFELGSPIEEIEENFPSVPREMILQLINFAHTRQRRSA